MSKQMFVVMGTTGEYSDSREWPVRAYRSEAEAQAEVLKLEEWCRVNVNHIPATIRYDLIRVGDLKCPLDIGFQCDYTGTHYYYMEVPLADESAGKDG